MHDSGWDEYRVEQEAWELVRRASDMWASTVAFADSISGIWRLGDGEGGAVLNELTRQLSLRGFVSRYSFVIRSDVAALAERDGWHCHYCNVRLGWGHPSVVPPEVDHKTPRSLGGSNDLDNLVLSCGACNSLKGATPYEMFKR